LSGEDQSQFTNCLEEIEGCIRLLEPMTLNFKSEASAKIKRVLVADTDKKQLLLTKIALGGTGVKLKTTFDPEEAKKLASAEDFDLVLASIDVLDVLSLAQQRSPTCKIVFMASDMIPEYLPKIQASNVMPNIVSRHADDKAL